MKPKKDLSAFRAQFDRNVTVPNRIREALAELHKAEGDEGWEYESDLMRRRKISQTDISQFRDEFAAHVVETGGNKSRRVWFATVKAAKAAREALG